MDPDSIRESFDRHGASPDVSTDEYVRSRRIALGESVAKRERVYLDKCYWIALRDASLGHAKDEQDHVLLESLRSSVAEKRRICPISDALFFELLKQEDARTKLATAALVDELSEGVTLAPYEERIATEVAHFLYACAGHSVFPLANLVWSRLSHVLGTRHPVAEAFDPSEQRVIQKAFFDHIWNLPLTEMIAHIGRRTLPIGLRFEDLAKRLNRAHAVHAEEINSFAQLYRVEICGALSLAIPVAIDVMQDLASRARNREVVFSARERQSAEHDLYHLLSAAVSNKAVARGVPTLHIGALCHAAIRWDRNRKLTGNDLYDFRHAEAAVAYCDVFLTEHALRTLLQQQHLKVSQDLSCLVISSKAEAAKWVQQ
jgi:hypothetical protein